MPEPVPAIAVPFYGASMDRPQDKRPPLFLKYRPIPKVATLRMSNPVTAHCLVGMVEDKRLASNNGCACDELPIICARAADRTDFLNEDETRNRNKFFIVVHRIVLDQKYYALKRNKVIFEALKENDCYI